MVIRHTSCGPGGAGGAFVGSFKSVEMKFVFFIPAVRVAAYSICLKWFLIKVKFGDTLTLLTFIYFECAVFHIAFSLNVTYPNLKLT